MTTRSLRRGTLLPATLFMAGMLSGTTCSWDGPLGLGSSGGDKAHAEENNKAHAEESAQKAKVVSTGAVVLPSGLSVADVAEKVTPSVVSVSSERKPRHVKGRESPSQSSNPLFEYFFRGPGGLGGPGGLEGQDEPLLSPQQSLGSGVIISSAGVVITNNHVIEGADEIRGALKDGRELPARRGHGRKSDIAVLRVKAKDLPAIAVADSSALRTGDFVLAVGNPFGLKQTVTMGIVSAVGRANMGITDYEDFIQTDAAINPGNSGGALVTIDGRLAGINTAIASGTGGYQGVGFAIPSNMVVQIKDAILRDGRVVRGWLGLGIQDLNEELAGALKIDAKEGALVSNVMTNSPAAKAGLKRGDVIVAMDGTKVADASRLRQRVAVAGKGKEVKLDILRQGKKQTLAAKLGEQPSDEETAVSRPQQDSEPGAALQPLDGVELRDLNPLSRQQVGVPAELQGVLVVEVEPGSKAAARGLHEGDVIVEVNGSPTPQLAALHKALSKDAKRTLLLVYRDGSTVFMVLSKE